ncbi:MAG TPA: ribosomal L7Ae/L30e/S12e/Gadd45 family protein [Candidatus Nanoarchaeia archaeon]|nr:ribosomal L7Ae/L30e/S12e/Gadd45 family protein [Candidatus Nanoarchaeia archaeon]
MTIKNLKKDLKEKKVYYGFNSCINFIKQNKCSVVYLASNCPKKDYILKNCKIFGINSFELDETNKEIGVLCKKRFSISVLCFE